MAETYIVKITEQAQEQMQEIAHYIPEERVSCLHHYIQPA